MRPLSEIEESLRSRGIDYSTPEFYNDPAFKRAEADDPIFLENYAELIESQTYSEAYIERVRAIVPKVVEFLSAELARDGRLGACIDASLVLTKILERLGIWNYVSGGSLTIDFDQDTGVGTRYWAHFVEPGAEAKVGHAWVTAPPFKVIDLTIRQQQFTQDQAPFLPRFVLSEQFTSVAGVSLDDMVDQDLQAKCRKAGISPPSIHEFMRTDGRGAARFMNKIHPFAIRTARATLKYFPCMMGAPLEAFEDHTGHCFSGRSTAQVYSDLCVALGLPNASS